jgi:hypothetical protein
MWPQEYYQKQIFNQEISKDFIGTLSAMAQVNHISSQCSPVYYHSVITFPPQNHINSTLDALAAQQFNGMQL